MFHRFHWRRHRSHLPTTLATLAIVAIFIAGNVAVFAAEASRRPNVLLIMTDDQGYGDLACHGNPVLKTPHLDALFAESIRFTNFHVDPTCSPTRSALMTGRYSTRVGVWHTVMGRHIPRRDEVMMPAVFAAGGYRTAIFGKWHLGDNYPFRPQDRGFQEVLVHGGGGVGQIPDFWGNDYFDDTYWHNGQWKKFTGYCTDVFFREAGKFITANKDRPFFAYVSTNAPHGPYRVADEYSRPYEDKVAGDAELAKFYGMIANIDENVGRLLRLLDRLDLAKNTIVIFMTDNGTSRGATFTDVRGNDGRMTSGYNAGRRGRKGSPYDGGHRVPCFIRWPAGGYQTGRDIDQLTSHLDLLPTLIDLCELERPAGVKLDGTSLVPLLASPAHEWPRRILLAHHQELPLPEKWRFSSVMTQKWRLVNGRELYEIAADPGQKTDVSQRHPVVVNRLRAAYDGLWDEFSQRFDETSDIVVGSEHVGPAHLSCFEWHSSRRWWQRNIRAGFADNGFWALEVARPGDYEITLRRWPERLGRPIGVADPGGTTIRATKARLQIAGVEHTKAIAEAATAVTFRLPLDAGKTRLKTWLVDEDGNTQGAYYATVRRLDVSKN